MRWFERDPRRLQLERELMESRTQAQLRRLGDELGWLENLRSAGAGVPYQLVIVYPDRFPYEPPKAFIAYPDVTGAPHRFLDGSLCLFNNPAVASGVKTTALLVRNRAVVWFLAYELWRVTGEWMAPQH